MGDIKDLNVLDIYLDSENPRHDSIDDQSEIIKYLLKDEQVKNLAKDIATCGISPLDNFGVIEDKFGKYIVVEGNRRMCALILLNDPERSPSKKEAKYFEKLGDNNSKLPDKIRCVVFKNRTNSDIWVDRRHGGELNGVGIKQWNAQQKTRRNTKRGKSDNNALAQAIIEYGKEYGFLPEDLEEKILTTASRYLGNPHFRKVIGISSSRSEPEVIISVSYEEFDRVIEQFCSDLVDKHSGVDSRTKREDWEQYADQLIKKDIAPVKKNQGERKLSDKPKCTKKQSKNNQGNGSDKNNNTDTTHNPDKRVWIVPSDFEITTKNTMLLHVLKEMRGVKVDSYPLAVSLLTRAFLENLYSTFYQKNLGASPDTKTQKVHIIMGEVIKIIEKNAASLSPNERKALGALRRVQSNTNNVLSPKTLGANAHANHFPNPTELKKEWDNIEAIISYMLKGV